MAKKKKKSSSAPNIPQEVLDRVAEEQSDDSDDSSITAEEARKEAERRAERAARRAARRQKQVKGEKPKQRDDLGAGVVAEMLANPTTEVSEDAMKAQYNYVIADLRAMGILAAILFLALIGLGFLL